MLYLFLNLKVVLFLFLTKPPSTRKKTHNRVHIYSITWNTSLPLISLSERLQFAVFCKKVQLGQGLVWLSLFINAYFWHSEKLCYSWREEKGQNGCLFLLWEKEGPLKISSFQTGSWLFSPGRYSFISIGTLNQRNWKSLWLGKGSSMMGTKGRCSLQQQRFE